MNSGSGQARICLGQQGGNRCRAITRTRHELEAGSPANRADLGQRAALQGLRAAVAEQLY
jgi:hypothetical protein